MGDVEIVEHHQQTFLQNGQNLGVIVEIILAIGMGLVDGRQLVITITWQKFDEVWGFKDDLSISFYQSFAVHVMLYLRAVAAVRKNPANSPTCHESTKRDQKIAHCMPRTSR